MKHYHQFCMALAEHEENFRLIREYCERNRRVLKFYRTLGPGSYVYECLVEGGTREELIEFYRDHGLDKKSMICQHGAL